ncbi:ATP-binding cassette domain-containing protein [bacterium]|nr:ATP-binding cassette domain-containing protein [bacterium]
MIIVENLVKYYGKFKALDGVTFEAKDGEVLGLLGPNAAGKTTTMRILTTYLPFTSGKAVVAGHDVVKEPIKVREKIGYMPENPPLYNDMKVKRFLSFVGKLRGLYGKKLADRLEYVRDVCQLDEVWNMYISQISKGYRQRVGLASALIADPPVLILDEPTIGLDPRQIRYTRELIKELGGNHTVLLSTHILPEAEMTCDRVAIINKGKIIAVGKPSELAEKIRRVNAVRVELSGPQNEVEKALLELDGVIEIRPGERPNTFVVNFEPKWDVREQITRLANERGWTILELTPIEASLEEIFLELVVEEPDRTQAGAND